MLGLRTGRQSVAIAIAIARARARANAAIHLVHVYILLKSASDCNNCLNICKKTSLTLRGWEATSLSRYLKKSTLVYFQHYVNLT